MDSCFFTGHRYAPESIMPALMCNIEQIIVKENVTQFYVGGYRQFDRIASSALTKLRVKYPQIDIYRVLPYHPAERHVKPPDGFTSTFYPPGLDTVPRRLRIVRANRYMIDTCEYLIAYVTHIGSNASELLEYARRREQRGLIRVINLGDPSK